MKKVLSLVLALVLVLGMSAVSFAKINDTNFDLTSLKLGVIGTSNTFGASEVTGQDSRPEDKFTFGIFGTLKTGTLKDQTVRLTREDVRDLKLDVQIRATEGSSIVKEAVIDYDTRTYKDAATGKTMTVQDAKVVIKLVDEWVSTKDIDFEILAYLTSEKKRIHNTNSNNTGWEYDARVVGTFENYFTEVDEYDDYVYLYDTPVVKANDYLRDIKVDLGQGIAIQAKMFDGKKYYGKVSQEVKEADEAIVAKYPAIETVYYLQTIGLSSTGDVVSFYDLGDNFYVYVQNEDGNLVYIGRSNDKLPYFTKYFLASKELAVDTTLEVPGSDVEPEAGPEAGGDDAPANVNDNPSTGR